MARAANPGAICIGIESGILRAFDGFKNITIDFAIAVILTPGGQAAYGTSTGILFPESFVEEAERRGFESCTVGSVIAERLGGDGTDPHSTLTGALVKRNETLVGALQMALAQLRTEM